MCVCGVCARCEWPAETVHRGLNAGKWRTARDVRITHCEYIEQNEKRRKKCTSNEEFIKRCRGDLGDRRLSINHIEAAPLDSKVWRGLLSDEEDAQIPIITE